ncbi:MAG: hypothetical protein SGARI_007094 [Bacillariaceae sp.]
MMHGRNPKEPFYDMFIYLAGTNDLGKPDRSANDIVASILEMHKWVHAVPKIPISIGIAIPSSAYQSHNKPAAQKATTINQHVTNMIKTTAKSDKHQSVFVPFPFPFGQDEETQKLWAVDGLHFSEAGYKRLGEYLAEVITEQFLT